MRKRAVEISDQTTARLSVYLRCLTALEKEGIQYTSSRGLAERLQLNSAQIRKDLACFGEFGIRGVGYAVRDLRGQILRILGLTRDLGIIVVGAGRLGTALADYPGFQGESVRIVSLVDVDRAKIGQRTAGGVPIRSLEKLPEIARKTGAEIAILAVPRSAAQEVADRVVRSGIKAILNFTPVPVVVPAYVKVNHVDLTREIEGLAFFLRQLATARKAGTEARAASR